MTVLAVTTSDVMVTLHILGVVAAFGGAVAYPLWFALVRSAAPEQRALFHRAQARLGKLLIMPGMVVILVTGAWLASDLDVWGTGWVLISLAVLVVIATVGVGFLGPSEERLSQQAAAGGGSRYETLYRRVRLATWMLLMLVIAATFLMVARVPDGAGGGGEPASRGESLAAGEGCFACHRIGSRGSERPGGDLSTVGSRLSAAQIRALLRDPPSGMPSYGALEPDQLDALVTYLSQLR